MKRVFLVAVLATCSLVWAGPAAWYRWHSDEGGIDICSQTSPGDGWVPVKGPFSDALCKNPGTPR